MENHSKLAKAHCKQLPIQVNHGYYCAKLRINAQMYKHQTICNISFRLDTYKKKLITKKQKAKILEGIYK